MIIKFAKDNVLIGRSTCSLSQKSPAFDMQPAGPLPSEQEGASGPFDYYLHILTYVSNFFHVFIPKRCTHFYLQACYISRPFHNTSFLFALITLLDKHWWVHHAITCILLSLPPPASKLFSQHFIVKYNDFCLTPRSKILLQKLTVAKMIKKVCACHVNRSLVTVSTTAGHRTLYNQRRATDSVQIRGPL
jgi:hypothetical protein